MEFNQIKKLCTDRRDFNNSFKYNTPMNETLDIDIDTKRDLLKAKAVIDAVRVVRGG